MRRIALLVAVGTLLTFTPAAHAVVAPRGLTCGMVTEYDPTLPPYTFWGAVFAGPLTLTDGSNPLIVYSGSITCTVQINASTHAGADACSATGPTTGNAAVLPPTICSYPTSGFDNVYLCTHVNILNSTPRYYDANGGFWTSSTSASCELAIQVLCDTSTLPCSTKYDFLDPILCPILAIFFPPEGDTGIFWDCPPYSDGRPRVEFGAHVVVPDVAT